MTTRRRFFQTSIALGTAALAAPALPKAAMAADAAPHAVPDGRLVAVGFGAGRLSTQPASGSSVVTDIDLKTGAFRQSFLAMSAAHTLLPVGGGLGLCLPLDAPEAMWVTPDLKGDGVLTPPKGFLFSGHGLVDQAGGRAFISLRKKDARAFSDTGRIGVVDLKTRKLMALLDSGGVRPHDLAMVGGTIYASHYGDINYEKVGKTAVNKRQPRLVALSVATGRVTQVIDTAPTGSLTHIAAGGGGSVCGVPLNYFGMDEAGRRSAESALGGKAFELSVAEELEGRIGAPMPILVFDTYAGTVKALAGDPARQRRAQSVAHHPGSGRYFVTFSFSDTLACVDGDDVTYLSAFDLGLSFVRGVCAVDGTGLIAVTGEFRGVALVDAKTLAVVKRLDIPLYDNPHVTFVG